MTYVLILLAFILLAGGIVFSVLPPLPGPVLSYLALVCAHNSSPESAFTNTTLIIWAVIVVVILIADYTLPIMATKKFGGTKAGIWGGVIGTVVGLIVPIPFGIILGPLCGAIIGDLMGGNRIQAAIKSGFGSFMGFVVATSLKVLISVWIGVVIMIRLGGFAYHALF